MTVIESLIHTPASTAHKSDATCEQHSPNPAIQSQWAQRILPLGSCRSIPRRYVVSLTRPNQHQCISNIAGKRSTLALVEFRLQDPINTSAYQTLPESDPHWCFAYEHNVECSNQYSLPITSKQLIRNINHHRVCRNGFQVFKKLMYDHTICMQYSTEMDTLWNTFIIEVTALACMKPQEHLVGATHHLLFKWDFVNCCLVFLVLRTQRTSAPHIWPAMSVC